MKIFQDTVAKSAYKMVDNRQRIVGKWGNIEEVEGSYFIHFVQPDLEPLTEYRLTLIEKKLADKGGFTRLTGEAFIPDADEALVRFCIPLLGIKKRKQYSPETIQNMTERLRKAREIRKTGGIYERKSKSKEKRST